MTRLTVSLDPNADTGLLTTSAERVWFLLYDSISDRIIVHTAKREYFMIGTLKYWVGALNASGHIYEIVDRNVVVNVKNVTYIDVITRHALFYGPGVKQKKCTMSHFLCEEFVKKYPEIPNNII
ncbi:hypothetical protein [Paenibacillus thiaminolyticus]|uniref:hypothetical protein n=1 Tax=Paenibacillus thiaminolyticus TaxID=49283 RepID=UPI0025426BE6|nr:hypothetical protein [Paenibacillus thiaminolyticus]WII39509.1 hypothetical protein O0V01_10625 [Paenibacillus thiaminolyticus]